MSEASEAAQAAERARSRDGELHLWKPATVAEIDALPLVGDCQKCHKAVDLKQGAHACGD